VSEHWYETFFTGIVLDMWRGAVAPEMTTAEADFIEAELGLQAGASVLDVPCGNGRHAIELASRGLRVTGVDFAAEFLSEARNEAARRSHLATFVESDMRCLPCGLFDGAYCFGNSFGYLEEGGDQEFLDAVARAVKPGARFILNTGHMVESLLPNLRDEATYEVGDITMALRHRYDIERSVLCTEFSFTRNGFTDVRHGEAFLYTTAQLRRMLEQAGLHPIAWYGGTDREPFGLRSRQLFLVSIRRE
jgi:SAM-dependent methyltransferase